MITHIIAINTTHIKDTNTHICKFISNVTEGTLHAEAKLLHRGRRTAVSEFRITADDGTLIATGQGIFFCIADTMLY